MSLTGKAKLAGIVGWPVSHSLSPVLHGHWLAEYGIDGAMVPLATRVEDFSAVIDGLRRAGFKGVNVTVPHKEAAFALSQPDAQARAVGAVNTLWLEDDVLRSTNTDVEGFLDNLDASAPGWDRDAGKALVLGAGGAARAVIHGLSSRGIDRIVVANRTASRAEALQASFGKRVQVADWARLEAELADAAVVINTTTLGMHGQPALALDLARLQSHAIVADIVYVPVVTPLLAAARARGLVTADGLGMLLHQAVRGFALWFGKTPVVTGELRALVEADLVSSK